MPELHETTGNYVSFAHYHLWDSVIRHLALAEQHSTDSWYLHLSAAAAFEAYLNYLGEEILPSVWKDEPKYFTQASYKGTAGKLFRIAEEVGLALPGTSEKSYIGFSELQALRNKIVHARPSRKPYCNVHRSDKMPKFPIRWLELEAPPERIKVSIEYLEQLAIIVHSAIQVSKFKNAIFGAHPFRGLFGFGNPSVDNYG